MEFPEGMNIRFCFGQAPDQDGITLIIKQDKTSSGYIKLDTLSAVKPIYIHGDLTPTSNDCSLGSYNKYYSHIYCPLGDLVSLYEDLLHRIWNLE